MTSAICRVSCEKVYQTMKEAMKEFGYQKHRHIQALSSIWDGAFGENIYRLKVVNFFRKKISVLDAWQSLKYVSGRRMKIVKYVNIYFLSGMVVLRDIKYNNANANLEKLHFSIFNVPSILYKTCSRMSLHLRYISSNKIIAVT